MTGMRADRLFFYLMLLLVVVITLVLIWPYAGSVVLAITVAVILQPMHGWFMRRTGQRKGPAAALTLFSTLLLVVVPVLFGLWLMFESLAALSADVTKTVQSQESAWLAAVQRLDEWITSGGLAARLQLEPGQISQVIRELVSNVGTSLVHWLAATGLSILNLIVPTVLFISLLGTLLSNDHRAVALYKNLSPLDDAIDQIFLDRLRIMTKAMMLSIVVVAVVQGAVTGLLMALAGTPHVIPLTIASIVMAILPGGAAIVAIPVGLAHIVTGNVWPGLLIILGTLTLVAGLANQIRPLLVSKDAYLNRAFVLLSVFSGIALFGFMGIVYGPLIMILFSTVLEVYLRYYRPGPPSVTLAPPTDNSQTEPERAAKAAGNGQTP